jgi:uncharacterized membrane protein YphA (DoxX/SURF4 family)
MQISSFRMQISSFRTMRFLYHRTKRQRGSIGHLCIARKEALMTTSPLTFSPDETNDEATMTTPLADTIAFVARVLLSLPFLRSGLSKIVELDATADFMRAEGMPLVPLFLVGAIVLEVVGGLFVAAGYRARLGALALIVFLVPTTLIFHDFWTFTGEAAAMQRGSFVNNLGLLGGLAMVAAFGSGAVSVDAKTKE